MVRGTCDLTPLRLNCRWDPEQLLKRHTTKDSPVAPSATSALFKRKAPRRVRTNTATHDTEASFVITTP